ncbi:MAG: hypothetical protein D6730_06145 [Bacteroidetes bacterium]|nr:MAG: hypothetical protein D6730_06145 [Bacteroidota bacterium]
MQTREFQIRGVTIRIRFDANQVSESQIRQLVITLRLLPVNHLRHIPLITVGNRPPAGGGGSAHPGMPGGPYIRLNRNIFQSPWNRGTYNYTLLHEVGHVIDWTYNSMSRMRRDDRAGYQALLAHTHRGRTQGPGEHFADAYADFIIGKRMSAARRNALRQSTAFKNVVAGADMMCTVG